MTLDEAVLEYNKIVKEVQVEIKLEEIKNDFDDKEHGLDGGCVITDRVCEDLIPQINTYELSELDYYLRLVGEYCSELPEYKNRFSSQDWNVLYFILSTWRAQQNI